MNIMSKIKIKRMLNQLNLKADCFDGEVTPIIKKLKSNLKPQIKLYDRKCDACEENEKFQWYLLEDIIQLNTNRNLPFHSCKEECNVEGCVISLIVKEYDNPNTNPDYCYSKINKLEIIYI